MEMPKPTAQHQQLQKLVGSWIGPEQINPSPWDPQGGPAEGHIENRLALDGFAVIHDYEQERNGAVSFFGHGVFTWDMTQQRYVMHWWDSLGFPPNVFVGDFEGDVLTLIYESSQGHHRAIFDLGTPDWYTFQMDVSGDRNEWTTFMQGKYIKQE